MKKLMNNNILLSVIIPVYNTEKYLKKCLDSVVDSLKNFKYTYEVIIVNDGSNGNEENIINKYIKENKSFFYYKKSNGGLASTKNFGIKKARGKYLSFIDSDDYIDKNFYNEAFNDYITDKCLYDMVIYDWKTIDKKNNTEYIVEAKNKKYTDDKWGCIDVMIMPSSCNKIVKKELFNTLEFPDGYIYEDLGTTLILFCRTDKIKYINKPYYKYYLSNASIMRRNFNEKNLQMVDIFNILFNRLDKEKNLSIDDKQKMECMTYTRRFYESLLEPISKQNFICRYKLLKLMCKKIYSVNKKMKKNRYFIYEICNDRKIKKFFNKLLFFCLNKNLVFFLTLLLNKKTYYKFIHIKYIDDIYLKPVTLERGIN